MLSGYIYYAGDGEVSNCRQFFLYAFAGDDGTVAYCDIAYVGAGAKGCVNSNDKRIVMILLNIVDGFPQV